MADNNSQLQEIFSSVFPTITKENFKLAQPRTEFESWDSLSHMQLVSEIEQKFGVSFEMDEIVDINSPADFVTLIEKKKKK